MDFYLTVYTNLTQGMKNPNVRAKTLLEKPEENHSDFELESDLLNITAIVQANDKNFVLHQNYKLLCSGHHQES